MAAKATASSFQCGRSRCGQAYAAGRHDVPRCAGAAPPGGVPQAPDPFDEVPRRLRVNLRAERTSLRCAGRARSDGPAAGRARRPHARVMSPTSARPGGWRSCDIRPGSRRALRDGARGVRVRHHHSGSAATGPGATDPSLAAATCDSGRSRIGRVRAPWPLVRPAHSARALARSRGSRSRAAVQWLTRVALGAEECGGGLERVIEYGLLVGHAIRDEGVWRGSPPWTSAGSLIAIALGDACQRLDDRLSVGDRREQPAHRPQPQVHGVVSIAQRRSHQAKQRADLLDVPARRVHDVVALGVADRAQPVDRLLELSIGDSADLVL